jgi:hypothetical protein
MNFFYPISANILKDLTVKQAGEAFGATFLNIFTLSPLFGPKYNKLIV